MKKVFKLFLFFVFGLVLTSFTNVNAAGEYNIYIRDMHGRQSTYEVTPMTTILELKNKIKNDKNIPVERQKLIFAGTTLQDDKTIADYNIQLEATVHFIPTWELTFDKKISGTSSDISTALVQDNQVYTPEDPTRSGYTFKGWYEVGSSTEFDFSNSVDQDRSFYAKWLENITSLDLDLDNPIIGDEANNNPDVDPNNSKVKVNSTKWVKGTCANNLCNEAFDGTFEEGNEYYAYIELEVSNADLYIMTTSLTNNIKINGQAPEEVSLNANGQTVTIVAKVKAQENTYEGDYTSTVKKINNSEIVNPETGDNIIIYIVTAVIALIGVIALISYKKIIK